MVGGKEVKCWVKARRLRDEESDVGFRAFPTVDTTERMKQLEEGKRTFSAGAPSKSLSGRFR